MRPARAADHEAVLDLCAAAFDPVPRAYFAARQLAIPDFHFDDAIVALAASLPMDYGRAATRPGGEQRWPAGRRGRSAGSLRHRRSVRAKMTHLGGEG